MNPNPETPQPDGRGRHKFSDGTYGCPSLCPFVLNDEFDYDYHMQWHKNSEVRS